MNIFTALLLGVGLLLGQNTPKPNVPVTTPTPTPTIVATPTPHTHQCLGPNGTFTADNSVLCPHLCSLPGGKPFWAAGSLVCPTPTGTSGGVNLGNMPTPHDHLCTLPNGTSYEADNSVACPAQ